MKQARVKAPKKLSDAILLALNDLAVVESMPDRFKIKMHIWHSTYDSRLEIENKHCNVCFAGSVMANSLKVKDDTTYVPSNFSPQWSMVFHALNEVRVGNLADALTSMGNTWDEIRSFVNGCDGSLLNIEVSEYQYQPESFKEQMLEIAMMLQVNGF